MKRSKRSLWIAVLVMGAAAEQGLAAFHLMHIEQVIGGVNGDKTAQAVQLRMRSAGQNVLASTRIRAYDATGANPVTIYDFAAGNFTVASGTGRRILLVTPNFPMHTMPAAVDDVSLMVNVIPASYLAAGCITFETDGGGTPLCRLAWGGANYTGPTTVTFDNDSDGDVAPPFPGPLPSNGARGILLQIAAGANTTNNAADNALSAGAAVFRNNLAVPGVFNVVPCSTNGDCTADGVTCTNDACVSQECTYTANDANCSDNTFCNGAETCNAVSGCQAGTAPCTKPEVCLEDTDECALPAPAMESLGFGALLVGVIVLGASLLVRRQRIGAI